LEFSVRIWKWSFSFLIFRRILLGNVERRLGEKKRALLSKEIEISLKGGPEAFGLGLKSGTPGLDLLITKHYAIRSCG
jgi:hypothetical protein